MGTKNTTKYNGNKTNSLITIGLHSAIWHKICVFFGFSAAKQSICHLQPFGIDHDCKNEIGCNKCGLYY